MSSGLKRPKRQLTGIPSDETVEELLALAAGLARFPQRGRHVPELQGRPEYEIVREVILPRKARVFYLFVPDSDEVIILSACCRAVGRSARESSARVSSRTKPARESEAPHSLRFLTLLVGGFDGVVRKVVPEGHEYPLVEKKPHR